MSNESSTEKQKQTPIVASKFYSSNFRRRRIYPLKRTTILIDPPQSSFFNEDKYKSAKHGAANWTLDGLGSKRCRLHGKIEGNLNKLRLEKDDHDVDNDKVAALSSSKSVETLVGIKRRRYASLIDDDEDE